MNSVGGYQIEIRSHLNVLKKGIIDEQAKSGELKESLRERELNLRKCELEIDSLNFRNQQLTKRVTILQDDLESQQSKGIKKNKLKKDDRNQPLHNETSNDYLLQEELQKKIIENAKLISQMADKEFEVSQLTIRIVDTEKQLSEIETKYKTETVKLKIQNQELMTNLESIREKNSLLNQSTPNKNCNSIQNNQISCINGDFISEVGSLIGSEDALSAEESHFNEQLKKKNELIAKIEQDNQSLKIEYDLLKLELESLKARSEQNVSTEKLSLLETTTNSNGSSVLEGLLGKINSPFVIMNEMIEREDNLKSYFREKISTLVADRQNFESMNKHYADENDGLRAQIDYFVKEKHILEDGLNGTQSTISKLEDELHSTSTNYEQQLMLLTEHVGNLNDKLAQQFEEIQQLKGSSSIKK